MSERIHENDSRLAIEIARGVRVAEAAKLARTSERTAYRRLNDPSFKEFVNEIRSSFLTETVSQLVSNGLKATETLVELCDAESE